MSKNETIERMNVVLFPATIERLLGILKASRNPEAARLFREIDASSRIDKWDVAYQMLADEMNGEDGTFEVDDSPAVSQGKQGAYVCIWRWFSKNDAKCIKEADDYNKK